MNSAESYVESHEVFFSGEVVTARLVTLKSGSKVKEFIDPLDDSDKTKVLTVLKLLDAKKGLLSNREKFKKLESYKTTTFQEIKSGQVRIGCVWEQNHNLMLMYGFNKKGDRWPKGDLEQLKNIYDAYEEEKKSTSQQ